MDRNMMTDWIWLPKWTPEDNADVRIVYFRKEFIICQDGIPQSFNIRISADSRYKLYVNGEFVQEGPQKAMDLKEWFADTADIAQYLTCGANVVAAEVLRYPAPNNSADKPNSNDSLYRTELPGLFVDAFGAVSDIGGRSGWKCTINREITVLGELERPAPIHAQEDVHATDLYAEWKTPGYDDSDWMDAEARITFDMSAGDAPGNLAARTIPPMRHEDKLFEGVTAVRECGDRNIAEMADEYSKMLAGGEPVVIPAHTRHVVEVSAGAEECGYLLYEFAGGRGAGVTTLCSECYAIPQPDKVTEFGTFAPGAPLKGDRTDAENGTLLGHTSYYHVSGHGSRDVPETYEPYWMRTFRYIRLEIETADEELTLCGFRYRATGYPLDVRAEFEITDPMIGKIWDISVRTLRRCMHETYMDCPFFEQLQYAMDTRSEALFTYAVSGDDRLARQAIEAFRRSQRPDGMINCDAPTVKCNVIPGFAIYYILMVHDHMMYFGDRALVKLNLPAIDQILAFFDRNLTDNGIVGKIGGPLYKEKYWSFADWTPQWEATNGAPAATNKGSGVSTLESLQYLYGLQKAAEISAFAGRHGLADEYLKRADELASAVRTNCTGAYTCTDGRTIEMIQDGPGICDYSIHCQVFGILTGIITPERGRTVLQAAVGNTDIVQSSVAFMFYLFRALEICGWYEKTEDLWENWRRMVRNNLTTCAENDTEQRSDCHAWASLMCYELPSSFLGVRPASPGFATVKISPQMGNLDAASGKVPTPRGDINVSWRRTVDGSCELTYSVPQGMEVMHDE